ncbi:MAG: hypothetical protein C0614_10190 [Desulfuromonas sp.]|nr:MAG: hypothetical protein C0614_10190 [Desulfuromonas sp.]
MSMTQQFCCPGCLSQKTELDREVHGYRIYLCGNCELAFTFPRPTLQEVADFYHGLNLTDGLYGGQKPFKQAFFALCNKEITKRVTSGKLLDFGCGDGGFLRQCDPQHFQLYGADLHPGVGALCRQQPIEFFTGANVETSLPDAFFDVIFSAATYEHFLDPIEVTKQLVRALKPGGILMLVSIPNYHSLNIKLAIEDWLINRPPAHINFFTLGSLQRLLQQEGLKVLQCWTYGFNLEPVRRRLQRVAADTPVKELVEHGGNTRLAGGDPQKPGPHHRLLARLYYKFPFFELGDKLAVIVRKPSS